MPAKKNLFFLNSHSQKNDCRFSFFFRVWHWQEKEKSNKFFGVENSSEKRKRNFWQKCLKKLQSKIEKLNLQVLLKAFERVLRLAVHFKKRSEFCCGDSPERCSGLTQRVQNKSKCGFATTRRIIRLLQELERKRKKAKLFVCSMKFRFFLVSNKVVCRNEAHPCLSLCFTQKETLWFQKKRVLFASKRIWMP